MEERAQATARPCQRHVAGYARAGSGSRRYRFWLSLVHDAPVHDAPPLPSSTAPRDHDAGSVGAPVPGRRSAGGVCGPAFPGAGHAVRSGVLRRPARRLRRTFCGGASGHPGRCNRRFLGGCERTRRRARPPEPREESGPRADGPEHGVGGSASAAPAHRAEDGGADHRLPRGAWSVRAAGPPHPRPRHRAEDVRTDGAVPLRRE